MADGLSVKEQFGSEVQKNIFADAKQYKEDDMKSFLDAMLRASAVLREREAEAIDCLSFLSKVKADGAALIQKHYDNEYCGTRILKQQICVL